MDEFHVLFGCLQDFCLKLADLDKSAPRLHGSMVFEVLALRFLMLFS